MTGRTYTHPSVLQGIADGADWADPVMDPALIDWAPRQVAAAIPFKVVNGRPVKPFPPTGIRYGRNLFGHWGEQETGDAIVTVRLDGCPVDPFVLMVERTDGNGWGTPGGYVERGESPLRAALRELAEEAGLGLLTGDPGTDTMLRKMHAQVPLTLVRADVTLLAPLGVDDPRGSDESWIVTHRAVAHLGTLPALPVVRPGDDALRAAWLPAGSYAVLEAAIRSFDPENGVFAAHEQMLAEFLG